MKPVICTGTLILLLGIATTATAAPEVLTGVSGIVIWIFLGYCALIVIAQLFAAMMALRRMLDDLMAKKNPSKKVSLR